VTVKIAPFHFESNAYSQMMSSEGNTSYRDPHLMLAVWHLPVALSYAKQS